MLILSRKQGQEIKLPGLDVTLRVLEIRGNCIRVGIAAPRDVKILRGELLEQADEFEFDFAVREREANLAYTKSGYEWPLGVSYHSSQPVVAKCA